MASQREPIDIRTTPIGGDAWKAIMKWPSEDVVRRPIDYSNRNDKDVLRTVYLIVKLPDPPRPFLPPPPPSNPTYLHWSIRWEVDYDMDHQFERVVHIEHGAHFLEHLTNWGPITKVHDISSEASSLRIPIADMNLAQRQHLERIALTQPVEDSYGVWNCQWTADVLTRATIAEYDSLGRLVHPPLISDQQKDYVLWRARTLRREE